MIPILSGNVASALGGGYEVANSLRFDTASSTDLVYTPSSTGSRRTFTWSVWIKRSKLGASQQIFTKKEGSGSDNNGNGNADYLALTYFNSYKSIESSEDFKIYLFNFHIDNFIKTFYDDNYDNVVFVSRSSLNNSDESLDQFITLMISAQKLTIKFTSIYFR